MKTNVVEINSKRHYEWFNLPCPFCKKSFDIYVTLELKNRQKTPCPNCKKGKNLEAVLTLSD